MSAPILFDDLKPRSVAVAISGEEYVLREVGEDGFVAYQSEVMASVRTDGVDKPRVESYDRIMNLDNLLVSICVTKNGQPVPRETVRTWPRRIVKRMADWVKVSSEMEQDDKKDDVAKNESGATSAVSS